MVYINENGGVRVGVRITAQQLEVATYLLDSYGGAAAAYSLRRLSATYSGSAIRVRRSNDNAEQNIGFDASGNLDTTALTTFVGANNTALYSEELDNASWSKGATTNQTTAPDGTMTADLVSETATSINHGIAPNYTSVSFPTGTSWNMSVYVKKGPGVSAPNTFALSFNIGGTSVTADPLVLFSFSTGGGTISLPLNTWFMATFIFDRSSSISIYYNGVNDVLTSSGVISQWNGLNFQSNNPFRIGSYTAADNTTPNSMTSGSIGITQIYDRVLSQSEITQNFNATKSRFGL